MSRQSNAAVPGLTKLYVYSFVGPEVQIPRHQGGAYLRLRCDPNEQGVSVVVTQMQVNNQQI